ncbi:MAG: DUF6285 domain-containing protein [Candidatus Binatia bacterium]
MQDKPTAIELLEALAAFLREEVAPRLGGGLRFKALVGANAAGIVAREMALGPAQDRAQQARLAALLGREAELVSDEESAALVREMSFELCRRIDAGDADSGPWREQLLAHLRAVVAEKLAVDNPRLK